MFCCNFAKTSTTTPLLSLFSSKFWLPRSPSIHSRSITFDSCLIAKMRIRVLPTGVNPKTLNSRSFSSGCVLNHNLGSVNPVKNRNLSPNGMKSRVLSSGSAQSVSNDQGKTLPWIAAYKEKDVKEVGKRASERSSRSSSWEESAERYFCRNGKESREGNGAKRVGSGESSKSVEVEVMEDEDVEPIDDPRWNKIKSRYSSFSDTKSRFESPEARRWSKQENWGRKTLREATESSMPKMVGQGVYGVGPVLAALTAGRREFYALYVQEGLDLSGNNRKKKDKKGIENVLRRAEKIGLKVIETSKHDLNMVVDNRPHQGLVLDASPLEMISIKELEPVSMRNGNASLWVALDEVTDPQNLGAIIRSAYFFGAEGVILCAKNSAPLSGVVSKASAGSLELIELRSCKNMMQFLSSSFANGWRVLGGSVSSRAVPLNEVEAGVPTILVLGSEGTGLRPLVEKCCTQLVRIPGNMPGDGCEDGAVEEGKPLDGGLSAQELKFFLAVESLNVSVAAGVLLYHLVGKPIRPYSGKSN